MVRSCVSPIVISVTGELNNVRASGMALHFVRGTSSPSGGCRVAACACRWEESSKSATLSAHRTHDDGVVTRLGQRSCSSTSDIAETYCLGLSDRRGLAEVINFKACRVNIPIIGNGFAD